MVGPVSFNTASAGVHFRGNEDFNDLVGRPGAYSIPDSEQDVVDLSGNAKKKKGKFGKFLLSVLGAAVVVGGALFGLSRWKGAKWAELPENAKLLDKVKYGLAKAGEWVDNKIVKGVGKLFKKSEKAADDVKAPESPKAPEGAGPGAAKEVKQEAPAPKAEGAGSGAAKEVNPDNPPKVDQVPET